MKLIIFIITLLTSINTYAQKATAQILLNKKKLDVVFFTSNLDKINNGEIKIGDDSFQFIEGNNIDHVAYMIINKKNNIGGMLFFLKRNSSQKEVNLRLHKTRAALIKKDKKFLEKNLPPFKNIKDLNCSLDSELFLLIGSSSEESSYANCLENFKINK